MTAVTTRIEDKVAIIEYNNPPLNVLTMGELANIQKAVEEADANDDVVVILFTMAMQRDGKVFCAGMDLDEMLASSEEPNGTEDYCRVSKENYASLFNAKKPVVYVFDGVVRGGGLEMSLFADFRFAGERVNIALPEIGIGIFPGGGGTQTLQRLIGVPKAKELIFTGRVIKAEEAKDIGLVNDVFPSDEVLDKAIEFAKEMAKHSPQGLQAAKRSIQEGQDLPFAEALKNETDIFVKNFETEDAAEGITAFREKRDPVYKNK